MAKDFYPDIIAALKAAGCTFVRVGKGNHEIWYSPVNGINVSVPRSKSRHSANDVLKAAGLPKQF